MNYFLRHIKDYNKGLAVLSGVSALAFAILAVAVMYYKTLAGETTILAWVHSLTTPVYTEFFVWATHIGDIVVVVVAALMIAAYFAFRKQRQKACVVLLLVGGSIALNVAFKLIFHRARPELWEHLVFETGYSFPSGHAMLSLSLLASIVITMWHQRGRWLLLCLAVVAVLLVGLSRLYLGVHYPSDVLAGWFATLSFICAVLSIYAKNIPERIHERHS